VCVCVCVYVCDSGVSVWLLVAVPSRGPLLIMFKIDPKFNRVTFTEHLMVKNTVRADTKSCR